MVILFILSFISYFILRYSYANVDNDFDKKTIFLGIISTIFIFLYSGLTLLFG